MTAKIGRLGHAVLYVSSLERSLPWYRDVPGMTPVMEEPSFGRRDRGPANFRQVGAKSKPVDLVEP